jgi:creatinine amidohydrolase
MTPRPLPLHFADCTWKEMEAFPRETGVLFLPVGSTEAHGPHLPLGTDVVISEAMAVGAATMLRERGAASLVLPAVAYSVTDFAGSFAGSLSVRFETARELIADVCRAALGQGFRRLCVANSHLEPRHVDSINAALEAVKAETGVAVAFPDKRRRRWATALTEEFVSGACHAGQYESSIVMAVRPELVDDEIRRALPDVEISLSDAIRAGKSSFREIGGDEAYFGRPAGATAEEGRATLERLARMLVTAVDESYGLGDGVRDDT